MVMSSCKYINLKIYENPMHFLSKNASFWNDNHSDPGAHRWFYKKLMVAVIDDNKTIQAGY